MPEKASERHDVVPTHLAVKAMRDNGYKSAAYALAELMDNSIQAGAKEIELLCVEKEERTAIRTMRRINRIGVLDNGSGMDATILRVALQFGNGSYLKDRTGIGRFGMGLPSASISQCKRVDVWSWTEGPDKALHTYIDLGEIERKEQLEIPIPTDQEIPDFWRAAGNAYGTSGSLVVWSEIDRCMWRTGQTIIRNSEAIIGRMYRRFLDRGAVSIRMATILDDNPSELVEGFAHPNDPMYLMNSTTCPEPYDNTPMFKNWGEESEIRKKIDFNGSEHEVVIRFSIAKEEARKGHAIPGSTPHGKHAAKNVGVSIMRADRELELSSSWDIAYDVTERWWGVEINFPPALDELFGVTNTKQNASYLSDAGKLDVPGLLSDKKMSMQELMDDLRASEDPTGPLLDISQTIHNQLGEIRRLLKLQTISTRSRRRHQDPDSPEAKATKVTRDRQAEGIKGESDKDEDLPTAEKKKLMVDEFVQRGLGLEDATRLAATTIDTGLKFAFSQADLETSAFFSVKSMGGALIITLNTRHPAYEHLVAALETPEGVELTKEDLQERFLKAWRGLRLLLEAWARYEDEQPAGDHREAVQDARSDWGRVARDFLKDD